MKPHSKVFLSILLLFFFSYSYAQRGFYPGYVVTLKKDTIYGKVKDRSSGYFPRMYKKIKFKEGGIFTKKYNATKISAYKRGGEEYESLWFEERRQLFREKFYSRPHLGEQTFLRVVERGYLNLYYFEYIDNESGVLDFIPLFKRTDEDFFVRVTQGILGLKRKKLSGYLADCNELVLMIDEKKIKSPQEIARYYNNWASQFYSKEN